MIQRHTGVRVLQAPADFTDWRGLLALLHRAFAVQAGRIELVENHRAFQAPGFETVAELAHLGYSRPTFIRMRKPLPPDGSAALGGVA